MKNKGEPVIAIAHDYLTQKGGAERLVLSLSSAFPQAKIYTTLFEPQATFPQFADKDVETSWLNRVGLIRRNHRLGLLAFPFAASSLKIDADVVIASSSAWAHGITTQGKVIVYCHSPARFLYLPDEYLGSTLRGKLKRKLLKVFELALIKWDQKAAHRAVKYIANSTVIKERIRSVYDIDAEIVFPPQNVDLDSKQSPLSLGSSFLQDEGFFLVVSRLLPYKNVREVVEAFRSTPSRRLVIIGHGPLRSELAASLPHNVVLFSNVSEEELRWAYAHCLALIAPSYEDFGLTVIEAAAWGKPSIALEAGGYLDTVVPGKTGQFISSPNPGEIAQAVNDFDSAHYNPAQVVAHAQRFDEEHFITEIVARVEEVFATLS